jgi:hypothetical protein
MRRSKKQNAIAMVDASRFRSFGISPRARERQSRTRTRRGRQAGPYLAGVDEEALETANLAEAEARVKLRVRRAKAVVELAPQVGRAHVPQQRRLYQRTAQEWVQGAGNERTCTPLAQTGTGGHVGHARTVTNGRRTTLRYLPLRRSGSSR